MRDQYVVCVERDTYNPGNDSHPISWETNLDCATLENAIKHRELLNGRYGEVKIAKLVYVDDMGNELQQSNVT